MATTPRGYDAFISYSHALDGKLAPTLQTLLERFAKPWYRARALRVFRDDASLSANPDLWSSIESALAGSSWLVLLASPEAARSEWVDREFAWWLNHKRADRLLVALAGGRYAVAGEYGSPGEAALPPAMSAVAGAEPRWVDLRWLRDTASVDGSNPRLRECVADIAAAIRDTPKDLLVGEHIRQHRRTIRLARSAVAGLVLLAVTALVAAFVAVGQRDNAVFNQILTRAEQLQSVDVSLAAQLSALAYEKNQTPEAYTALVTRANQARSTVLTGHSRPVRAVASDSTGRWLASGAEDSTIRIWDPANGPTAVIQLPGEDTAANSFAVGADGRLLVAGISDGTVRMWDLGDLRAPRPIGEPVRAPSSEPVVAVALSPDGRTLATGNAGNELRLWDITNPARPRPGDTVLPGYRGLAFSSNGRMLAAGDLTDDSVGLFDTSDPVRPALPGKAVIGRPGENVNTVAISPDGRTLVSGGSDRYAQFWDITDPTAPAVISTLVAAGNAVTSAGISADGSKVAIASADAFIQLVSLADPRHPSALDADGRLNTLGSFVLQISLAPDGRHMVSGHSDGAVRYWELPVHYTGNTSQVQAVEFSPDGRTLAAAGHDRLIRLWRLNRPSSPTVLAGHSDTVWRVRFSPDGRTLASAGGDGVRLWDLDDPGAVPRVILGGEAVSDVVFSPDSARLSTVGAAVRLWSLADPGRPAETLGDAENWAVSVTFLSDGRGLAVGYENGWIDLWDLTQPAEPPLELDGHAPHTVTELVVSPDGRYLASAGADQTVRLWDVTDPERREPVDHVLTGHTNTVYGLAFSPDGTRLASGGEDQTVRLWNLDDPTAPTVFGTPLPLGPGRGAGVAADSVVTSVDYSPDGRSLAITGADRTVRLWDLDPSALIERICRTAAGNLTEHVWRQYFRNQSYEAPQCG